MRANYLIAACAPHGTCLSNGASIRLFHRGTAHAECIVQLLVLSPGVLRSATLNTSYFSETTWLRKQCHRQMSVITNNDLVGQLHDVLLPPRRLTRRRIRSPRWTRRRRREFQGDACGVAAGVTISIVVAGAWQAQGGAGSSAHDTKQQSEKQLNSFVWSTTLRPSHFTIVTNLTVFSHTSDSKPP